MLQWRTVVSTITMTPVRLNAGCFEASFANLPMPCLHGARRAPKGKPFVNPRKR